MRGLALLFWVTFLVAACASPGATASSAIDRTDARFLACGGDLGPVAAAFPFSAAQDYHVHFPKMGLSPELDVPTPAFVVVFAGIYPGPLLGAAPPPGTTWPPRSLAPGAHDLCIWVGDVDSGEANIYTDVDTTGMTR